MSTLVVASNRGPFAISLGPDGEVEARPAGGGLAPSLASALAGRDEPATWVAAAMSPDERTAARSGAPLPTGSDGLTVRLVDIDEETYAGAYDVIANTTLWYCHHGLFDAPRRPLFDRMWRAAWEQFRSYNLAFAEAICDTVSEGASVLVNDYHLPLVGGILADRLPELATVHFTHTPWASPSELDVLPRDTRRELIDGMAGYGACGFHVERWASSFRSGAEVYRPGATAQTFAASLGADPERLASVAASPECAKELADLEALVGERQLIVRSDRIELSKNLLRGFLALDALLEERPEHRGRVVLLARAYASRDGLADYLAYRSEAEHLVEVLNEKWRRRCGGDPILLRIGDDFAATIAALRRYDVLLVNPVRDGMNLVAKEGPVLNERHGVLVLSEAAGAYDDLGDAALGVQPFDVADTAAALARALAMAPEERTRRSEALRAASSEMPPSAWLSRVLSEARAPRRAG